LGDPLYNLAKSDIERILDNKMSEPERVAKTGAKRLMLHAKGLVFDFRGQHYEIFSAKKF
ncbi:MAG: RNA pseudouridine synthase, partial [Campylobacteraceae bacterium]|nr:RNA pseudouridine synthase [Campylobacteraceae bacterium]